MLESIHVECLQAPGRTRGRLRAGGLRNFPMQNLVLLRAPRKVSQLQFRMPEHNFVDKNGRTKFIIEGFWSVKFHLTLGFQIYGCMYELLIERNENEVPFNSNASKHTGDCICTYIGNLKFRPERKIQLWMNFCLSLKTEKELFIDTFKYQGALKQNWVGSIRGSWRKYEWCYKAHKQTRENCVWVGQTRVPPKKKVNWIWMWGNLKYAAWPPVQACRMSWF